MSSTNENLQTPEKKKIKISSYVALFLTLAFLSGFFKNMTGPLAALDLTNVLGSFGKLGTVTLEEGVKLASNFRGTGGAGVKDGFMSVIEVAPTIILCFGIIELYNAFGGSDAAEKLFGPIMRFFLGVPGAAVPALVSNLTSSDASAGLCRSLHDEGRINQKENIIITSFLYSAASPLVNYYLICAIVFPYIEVPLAIPMLVMIAMKFVGPAVLRFFFMFTAKKEAA